MKLPSSVIISTLCWSVRLASAASAHVYTFDSESSRETGSSSGILGFFTSNLKAALQHPDESLRTLSPTEAQVVLAQRAGADEYHGASLAMPGVLEAVNDFGLKTPLFGADGEVDSIVVLAQASEEAAPSMKDAAHFAVSPVPSLASARQLFSDLALQRSSPRPDSSFHDLTLHDAIPSSGIWSLRGSTQQLESYWTRMLEVDTSKPGRRKAITMIVYPPSAISEEQDSKKTSWTGGYRMPGDTAEQPILQKRQLDTTTPSSTLTTFQDDSDKQSPLPGILPACYPSQAECESTTRNCTGHGACSLAFVDKTSEDGRRCYSCSCRASVAENSDGEKSTTYWSGPACQKRDVSTQFWLIALFSVGMVFLISFAVGTLWSMGEETLPSVIGAGVSGPSARR